MNVEDLNKDQHGSSWEERVATRTEAQSKRARLPRTLGVLGNMSHCKVSFLVYGSSWHTHENTRTDRIRYSAQNPDVAFLSLQLSRLFRRTESSCDEDKRAHLHTRVGSGNLRSTSELWTRESNQLVTLAISQHKAHPARWALRDSSQLPVRAAFDTASSLGQVMYFKFPPLELEISRPSSGQCQLCIEPNV